MISTGFWAKLVMFPEAGNSMLRKIALFILPFLLVPGLLFSAGEKTDEPEPGVRLKDIARVSSVRSNRLTGFGIVAGLPGTGDTRSPLARESLQNMLQNMGMGGVVLNGEHRNVAAVLVTAELPPFARKGDLLRVHVSSIGDARSLEGGILMPTQMMAQNRQVYAVAQGVLTSGDERSGKKRQTPVTSMPLPAGAQVERETEETAGNRDMQISLHEFDFTTLSQVYQKLQAEHPELNPRLEGGSVVIRIPEKESPVKIAADLEGMRIQPDLPARVVINERTGTIVMGGDVRIDPVVVSKTGLGQKDREITPDAARMGIYLPPLKGEENKEPETLLRIEAKNVEEFVETMNKSGASTREMISILQALKDSGALRAELIII